MPARYRSLLRLYPRDFRVEYGEDLVQAFADLVADRGARSAWARTALDLAVTVPRYRLEAVMSQQRTTTALTALTVLLGVSGVLTVLLGVGPGLALLVVAVVLALSQRSALARSLRTPDPTRRRHRLVTAAVLAGIFAAALVSYSRAISDDDIGTTSLIVHNAVGIPAMIGALAFLVAGLLTPRLPQDRGRAA